MINSLPNEWLEVDWEQLTNLNDGFKRGPFGGSLKKEIFVESGYAVYEQYHPINDDCSNFRYFIDENKFNKLKGFDVKAGDFLISCSGTMGRITRVGDNAPIGVINQALLRIRLNENIINPNYFIKLFRSSSIQNDILSGSGGGAIQNLASVKDLKKTKFPLPPLAEQEKIAELLDSHLAQVETIKTRLNAIAPILKKFRQSVLADAVSGRLIEFDNISESKIKDIADFQNGYAFKSEWFLKEGEFQVIKLGNIRDNFLFLENAPAYITSEIADSYKKFIPNKNDILISMTGTRFKKDYGFCCLVNDKQNILVNQRVGRFLPKPEKINPKFLLLILRSDFFRNEFFKGETGGVNQGNVGSKHIEEILIRFPSLETQGEIVQRVEELFAFADTIETQITNALQRVNQLTQSILHQAFTGKLTADWRAENIDLITGDNSAESLLAKIQAEKDKAKPVKKPRKKKEA